VENETITDQEPAAEPATQEPFSNLPFVLTLAALLIYFGFQSLSLWSERSNLGLVKSSQDAALQEAQKVQAQFKTLVAKTSELADKGHAGAKLVMEGLQRQGMSVSAPPEGPAPTKAETKLAK
jgi:hypothetical protein